MEDRDEQLLELPEATTASIRTAPVLRLLCWLVPSIRRTLVLTLGKTTYLPDEWSSFSKWECELILVHERVHLRQQRFSKAGYLLLKSLVLPAFWCPFRRHWEKEAWEVTIAFAARKYGSEFLRSENLRSLICRSFTTATSLWCWPRRRAVDLWITETIEKALAEASA